ncbi:MAG: hypothetical protein FJW38_21835 [Acidobacteria bacterium]|nr:hypothetical protein [Acidobacteriota bacterium]
MSPIFTCAAAGSCTPSPIDPTEVSQIFVLLYGTGLRGRTDPAAVSVTIAGQPAESSDAVAQGQFLGLDQINVRVSPTLAGRGTVNLVVTIDGRASNTVTLQFGGAAPPPPPRTGSPSRRAVGPRLPACRYRYAMDLPRYVPAKRSYPA